MTNIIEEKTENLEEKIWGIGFDAVFKDINMPAGYMDGSETGAAICADGYSYQKAKTLVEAREKVKLFIKRTYVEPLLNIVYYNTHKVELKNLPEVQHIVGLTQRYG
ncbi:MAG: hypothetical protein WCK29_00985 [archaeon]